MKPKQGSFDTILRTREDLEYRLGFVRMRTCPFPMKLALGRHDSETGYEPLMIQIRVRDRLSGVVLPIQFDCDAAYLLPMSEPDFVSRTMLQVANVFIHEACESFHYSGRRVFDPHKGGTQEFISHTAVDVRLVLPENFDFHVQELSEVVP